MTEELSEHRRMRKCLLAIRDLDPSGVDARLRDMDAEIERLEQLLGVPVDSGLAHRAPAPVAVVKAA